jgi:hypothetical protein
VQGIDFDLKPITSPMNLIYDQRKVLDQWLASKNTSVCKNKGSTNNIINYRTISNLCSTTKVFKKLTPIHISEVQELGEVDLTGEDQQSFQKEHTNPTITITDCKSII